MTASGWVAISSRSSALLLVLFLGACGNVLRYFPDAGSDSYKIDQAKICLDQFDFDCAVESIDPVLESQPDNPEVVAVGIAAYAGRGDLRILDLMQEISSGLSTSNLFDILAEHFPQADAAERSDVARAVEILETFESEASERTASMNVLAFFLYYGQIGVILSDYAYDGAATVAPGWDSCADDDLNLPTAEVQLIGRALANVTDSAENMPSNSAVSTAFDSFSSAFDAMGVSKTLDCSSGGGVATCATLRSVIGSRSTTIGVGPGNTVVCP